MRACVAEVLGRPGLKLGHYVGEFVTPGIGYILKEAGADYVFFDMEHSGNSHETLNRALRYFEAADVPVLVRVSSDTYSDVARALDVGAEAIIVPMLGSAEQAQSIIQTMKYTPIGKRGLSLGIGNDRYRIAPVVEALAAANKRTRLIAMIETVEGVENVDEIAAVDGVDALWVGHMDLTASMGIPGQFDHSSYQAALARVLEAGKRHKKGLGRIVADVASGVALAQEGWDLIVYFGDVSLFHTALREGLDSIRSGLEARNNLGLSDHSSGDLK